MALAERPNDEHLMVGDFNLHHPLWTGPGRHQHSEADELIDIIDTAGMHLITEEGTQRTSPRRGVNQPRSTSPLPREKQPNRSLGAASATG